MARQFEKIGRELSASRKSLGLRQSELADIVGCRQPALSAWERGENAPSHEYRQKLCDALSLNVTRFEKLIDEANLSADRKSQNIRVDEGELESAFARRAINAARSIFGENSLEIELVAPEKLPVVDNVLLQKEWAQNLSRGCNYRIYWFTDFLLQNLSRDPDDEGTLLSFASALRDIVRNNNFESGGGAATGMIEHIFIWSDCAYLDLTKSEMKSLRNKMVRFLQQILILPLNRVFIEGCGQVGEGTPNNANCMLDHIDKYTSYRFGRDNNEERDTSIFSEIHYLTRFICGDFWSNGDSLVVYRHSDPHLYKRPMGYRQLRRGYSFYKEPGYYPEIDPEDMSLDGELGAGARWLMPNRVDTLHAHLSEIREIILDQKNLCT